MTAFSGYPWMVPYNVGQYFGGGNINQQGGNYTASLADIGTVVVLTNPNGATLTLGEFGEVGDSLIVVAGNRTGGTLAGDVTGLTSLPPGQAVLVTLETGGAWNATPCE